MSDENQGQQNDIQDSAAEPAVDEAVSSRRRESKETRIRREQREADAFWGEVYRSEVGRREMWQLIAGSEGAHAFETRFACGPSGVPDPIAAWHAKGEQDFGLRLYHKALKRSPQSVLLMHQENDHRFAATKRSTAGE